MKRILGISLFSFLSVTAIAAPLPLSSTFEIRPQDKEIRWNYLPTLNSWRAEANWQKEKFSVTVIHAKPPAFANDVSVKKQWADQARRASVGGKVIEDKKCKRSGRVNYVCERTINENNQLLANEKIYWNENTDYVLVRVSTPKNREALSRFSERLNVNMASRLPASHKKAVKK
jgi:hypothetical protein